MPALKPRSDVSFASVESMIRSLSLSVLYRVATEFIFSFTRLSFHTVSTARGSVPLSPSSRARLLLAALILGLTPQALCWRPLRGLASQTGITSLASRLGEEVFMLSAAPQAIDSLRWMGLEIGRQSAYAHPLPGPSPNGRRRCPRSARREACAPFTERSWGDRSRGLGHWGCFH